MLHATLLDNVSAQSFQRLLPLCLELKDYAETEKVCDLPSRLDTRGAPEGWAASAGDITYYAPWGNLAIFYRDFSYARGLVLLGRVVGDIDQLSELSSVKLSLRAQK